MIPRSPYSPFLAGLLVLASTLVKAEEAGSFPLRPAPSAGKGTTTLLIADAPARPFSLYDICGAVSYLLTRIQTDIKSISLTEWTPDLLDGASHIVLLGVTGTAFPPDILAAARASGKPCLIVGTVSPDSAAEFVALTRADLQAGPATFSSPVAALATAAPPPGAHMIASLTTTGRTRPLAWRLGNEITFASLPLEPATNAIFSDLLLDFYTPTTVGPSGILLIVEGLSLQGDPQAVRRQADRFSQLGWPYTLCTTAAPADADPIRTNAWISAIRYAQARGACVLMTIEGSFWDQRTDQPLPAPDPSLAALRSAWPEIIQAGVFPIGVRLPSDGIGRMALADISLTSRLAVGECLPSDVTALAPLAASTAVMANEQLTLLPSTLWLDPATADATAWQNAAAVLALRGTILGIRIPFWWPPSQMDPVVEQIKRLNAPVLDPLLAPFAFTSADHYLLGPNSPPILLPTGKRFGLRAFDRRWDSLPAPPLPPPGTPLTCPPGVALLLAEPAEP